VDQAALRGTRAAAVDGELQPLYCALPPLHGSHNGSATRLAHESRLKPSPANSSSGARECGRRRSSKRTNGPGCRETAKAAVRPLLCLPSSSCGLLHTTLSSRLLPRSLRLAPPPRKKTMQNYYRQGFLFNLMTNRHDCSHIRAHAGSHVLFFFLIMRPATNRSLRPYRKVVTRMYKPIAVFVAVFSLLRSPREMSRGERLARPDKHVSRGLLGGQLGRLRQHI
jgi:hypothetical protein